MGRKFTVYGLRFSKTSFWNRMNTGFLDPAVATVPTACGIETFLILSTTMRTAWCVATVPTACGIETQLAVASMLMRLVLQQYLPLAVLKLFCIIHIIMNFIWVATVPTACGIETMLIILA